MKSPVYQELYNIWKDKAEKHPELREVYLRLCQYAVECDK